IYILNVLKHIFSIHESQDHKYLNGRFPSNAAAPWQLLISLLPFNSIDVMHIPVHSLSIVRNALEFFFQLHMSYILSTVFLIPQVDMASQKRPAEEGLIKNPVKRLRTDEHYSRTKRVLFYIPDPSAADKKVKAEFLLCEEFAGICIVVFEAGVYYYNKK